MNVLRHCEGEARSNLSPHRHCEGEARSNLSPHRHCEGEARSNPEKKIMFV